MATYVNDLRLKEITTGDESGTWGTSTNTNLELIAEAFSYGTADFASDADDTFTIADGSTDPARSLYLKVGTSTTLTATRTLTLAPNTVSKVWIIENATAGSQSISISQGSGANVTIPNGDTKVIYTDGAGATAAVTDAFANLKVTDAAQTNITSVGTLTGLDVAGTPTFDGLTVDGTSALGGLATLTGSAPRIEFYENDTTDVNARIDSSGGDFHIKTIADDGGSQQTRIKVDHSTGDISFYDDTGVSQALFWDASAQSLGIGTTSPEHALHVNGGTTNTVAQFQSTDANAYIEFLDSDAGASGCFIGGAGDDFVVLPNASEKFRVTSSGNVGIGTSSPDKRLDVLSGTSNSDVAAFSGTLTGRGLVISTFDDTGTSADAMVDFDAISGQGELSFSTGTSERMRIDSSGNVGIGTTSPATALDVTGTITVDDIYVGAGSAGSPSVQMNDTNSGLFAPAGNTIAFSTAGGERMRIDSGGDVLVNCTSIPSASIRGFGIEDLIANVRVKTSCSTTAGFAHYEFFNPGGSKGTISTSAAGTSYNTSSDYRLKENIQPLADGLDRVQQLKPVQFDWKESGETSEGFIAHEVQEIFSDAVSGEKDGEDMQGMDYGRITPLLVKAIQEQQTLIEQLQAEVALLKGE